MNSVDLAVMDIGSNGIRILWRQGDSIENRRVALRLGEDCFGSGKISKESIQRLKKTCTQFAHFLTDHEITNYRIIGTAALREAKNGKDVIQCIRKKTGMEIEIIDAEEEARLLYLGVSSEISLAGKSSLLLDLGGGSGEFVILKDEKKMGFFTAPIGGVRILGEFKKKGLKPVLKNLNEWIEENLSELYFWKTYFEKHDRPHCFVATGGNPRALGKLARRLKLEKSSRRLSKDSTSELIRRLGDLSLAERRERFDLSKDRADVIFPSAVVLWKTMEIMGLDHVLVPPVGLKNGLLVDSTQNPKLSL